MMNYEQIIMSLITHGGDARSKSLSAISAARAGQLDEAKHLLKQADEEINKAHEIQTSLIQKEVRGEKTDVNLLMVHAQDHLMNAMTVRDLAIEIVALIAKEGE